MPKRQQIKVDNLSRLISYILGHKPDEFGLVPDREGFVTYKELLWAINEEPGWGYVKMGHINEVLLGKERTLFQPEEKRIRALDRRWHLDLQHPSLSLPKLLFIAVRRKAHAHVMDKGLRSTGDTFIVSSPDRDTAVKIGRRKDQNPVLMDIMASAAQEEGVSFYSFGSLFLTNEVPAKFIYGPPISPESHNGGQMRAVQSLSGNAGKTSLEETREKRGEAPDFEAGTFVLDLKKDSSRRAKGKKRRGWKEDARNLRRRR